MWINIIGNQFVPGLINTTSDLCSYYKNPTAQPLTQLVYPVLQKSGQVPNSCPVLPVS